ncbi:hypothetical protein HG66A1_33000 [Gimesia chilikensis]|uniref:Uncharacterized protein n=1 Tax=Gimesia chilikensis TaxID=2605989 RepID=A0A517PQ63_9PLAN|nr:hypothetical protein HG66A1_33000 [Gimesia chilikensis]
MLTKNHTDKRSEGANKFCTHFRQDPILSPKESAISDAFSPQESYDRSPTT